MSDPSRLFSYQVSVGIVLSLAEHAHLMNLSRQHYDHACRQISEPGQFLHGWEGLIKYSGPGLEPLESGVIRATWNELDILCKVCEMDGALNTANPGLCERLRNALTMISDEQRRVNGLEPNNLVFHVQWPRDKLTDQRPGTSRVTVTFEGWWDPDGERAPAQITSQVREGLRNAVSLLAPRGAQVRGEQEYRRWMVEQYGQEGEAWEREYRRFMVARYGRELTT